MYTVCISCVVVRVSRYTWELGCLETRILAWGIDVCILTVMGFVIAVSLELVVLFGIYQVV